MKLSLFFLILFIGACTMEPKYITPTSPVELKHRKAKGIQWKDFFQTPALQELIEISLKNNRDLRIAYYNIETTRINYKLAEYQLLPSVGLVANNYRQSPDVEGYPSWIAGLSFPAYTVDLFGAIRSQAKAGEQTFLATNEQKNILELSLISQITESYLQFLTDRESLKILKEISVLKKEQYEFFLKQRQAGLASEMQVIVAKNDYENSKIAVNAQAVFVEQGKTNINLLAGKDVSKILEKPILLKNIFISSKMLVNTPSTVLLKRPDIKQAEYNLKAANANIGVARAAFFPSLTLTGLYGFSNPKFSGLFKPSSKAWNFNPILTVPIFTQGQNTGNLKLAELQKNVNIATYEKTIQTAFKEVRDGLFAREALSKQLNSAKQITASTEHSYHLSKIRYKDGLDSKSNLLNAKIALLNAIQNQNTIQKNYYTNLINLYQVLGQAMPTNDLSKSSKSGFFL